MTNQQDTNTATTKNTMTKEEKKMEKAQAKAAKKEERAMKKEEKAQAREEKRTNKAAQKEVAKYAKELKEQEVIEKLHEANSETEAMTMVVGSGLAKFMFYALVLFLVSAGLYLLVQSIYVFLVLILSLISLFK